MVKQIINWFKNRKAGKFLDTLEQPIHLTIYAKDKKIIFPACYISKRETNFKKGTERIELKNQDNSIEFETDNFCVIVLNYILTKGKKIYSFLNQIMIH